MVPIYKKLGPLNLRQVVKSGEERGSKWEMSDVMRSGSGAKNRGTLPN